MDETVDSGRRKPRSLGGDDNGVDLAPAGVVLCAVDRLRITLLSTSTNRQPEQGRAVRLRLPSSLVNEDGLFSHFTPLAGLVNPA